MSRPARLAHRPTDAVLVVPPLFKTLSQPLLGPAMLVGAGRKAGHRVRVLDLNQALLREGLSTSPTPADADFIGDHDRPVAALRELQARFAETCRAVLPETDTCGLAEDAALTLMHTHDAVQAAARRLAAGPHGDRVRAHLQEAGAPDLVGVSVFWSGQVLFGLVVSLIARELWPGVSIVWGGPHVNALEHELAQDSRYAADTIDGFVCGYAEATWVDLLDAVARGGRWPSAVVQAGGGVTLRAEPDPDIVPVFDELDRYGWGRLCLPVQASRGCAYGRCTYCTYPEVEGAYRALDMDVVEPVVHAAEQRGAAVAFKDALVVPRRIDALAERIQGRVPWSVCTKLHRSLGDVDRMRRLRAAGLHTIEVGLETLTDEGQVLVEKRQPVSLFLGLLDAAEAAGIAVVVNYMTGLPGLDALDEQAWLDRVHAELAARPQLVAKVEHNTMQVERRSSMGTSPERFQLEIVRTWPWATVVAWQLRLSWAA